MDGRFDVLLMIHAAAGVAALAVGALALGRPHLVGAHLMLLMTCIGSLVGLIAVDWGSLDRISRALFVALGLLGVYMVWRGTQAWRDASGDACYIDHVGFTLVALFDAFVVVGLLDLGAPAWAQAAAGVAIAYAGRFPIAIARRHYVGTPRASSTPAAAS